jgi:transposase InsO family protein
VPRPRRPDEPTKPTGTRTRAAAKARIDVYVSAEARANRRLAITRFAESLPGMTLDRQWEMVAAAIEGGTLPGPVPSRAGLHRWLQQAKELGLETDTFRDRPRSGRPARPVPEALLTALHEEIKLDCYAGSVMELSRRLETFARSRGLEPLSYAKVRRLFQAINPAERAAASQGSRAARADTMVHSTYPADYAHEVWGFDAMTAPVWIRVFQKEEKRWIPVKVDVVLIIDYRTRVIVGYHVVDPSRRGKTSGYDHLDVLATLSNAAFPELAPEACRDFAGHLPKTLRWDRIAAQRAMMASLIREVKLDIPEMPGYTPWSRGRIERPVDTLKKLCSPIKGYADKWIVAEGAKEDPRTTRTKAGGTMVRTPTRLPIALMDLHTVESFQEEFDRLVIQPYNYEREHSRLGMTPEVAYRRDFDSSKARSGRDLLAVVHPQVCSVTKEGLVHRGVPFTAHHQGSVLPVGEQVMFRPDPMLRCLFAEAWGETVLLQTKEEWARQVDAEAFAKAQAAEARLYADEAAAVREAHRQKVLGPDGVARADAALRKSTAGKRRRKAQTPNEADAAAVPVAAPASAPRTPAVPAPTAPRPAPVRRPASTPAVPPGVFANLGTMTRIVQA